MITSPSTSNLGHPEPSPRGLPDVSELAALANALFSARPGGAPPLHHAPPAESQAHTIPAVAAGTTGVSPQPLLTPPTPTSGETCYYLLESARPTSPQVLPMANVAPPGLEPGIGLKAPVMATMANPRALPERSSVPGQHLGSTVPHTPMVELGTQLFVPRIPPASLFNAPTEHTARGVPAFTAGASKTSPQPFVGTDVNPPSDFSAIPSLNAPDRAPQLPQVSPTVPATPTPSAAIPQGSPVTATQEGSSGAYYFLGETYGLTATPRTPLEHQDVAATTARPELVEGTSSAHPAFDPEMVRRDFPILSERVNGRPLIWLDNAATTQKPQAVIDRLAWFYAHENSNIHRAAHTLAARATDAYEAARDKVARFLHAPSPNEIIFVRGTTEAINLIAQSWGRRHVGEGDEIIITWLEHHANIVPWQQLCAEKGAKLRVAPVDDRGQVILEAYEKLFNPRTRLVSFTQVSNALGTVTPVREMTEIAHRYGVRVLVDGAQAVSHLRVDVQALDCDWYVFSGHKVFGPTGIGAIYGKRELLETMPPWQGGGNMIQDVTFEKTIYQPAPSRFEAGTGNIADAVGLGAAIDYLERVGIENVTRHEHDLLLYGTEELQRVPGLRLIGTAAEKAGVLSFVLEGFRSEEVGEALNREGIAVRSGHHCAQPILRRFGLESTVRPSLALYNTRLDIDALVTALLRLKGGQNRLQH